MLRIDTCERLRLIKKSVFKRGERSKVTPINRELCIREMVLNCTLFVKISEQRGESPVKSEILTSFGLPPMNRAAALRIR